jgi:hypothetical protein
LSREKKTLEKDVFQRKARKDAENAKKSEGFKTLTGHNNERSLRFGGICVK